VSVSDPKIEDGRLRFDVRVTNNTGHKFPTGYPSRRAWLHVTVRTASGAVVFESGAINDNGLIAGADSDRDASTYERHYEEITTADQVQIYESILGDPKDAPTTGLLTATHYLKDNRLLPRGFDKATAAAEIAVIGGALGDGDFAANGDVIRYRVPVTPGGPFRIDVELRYQAIGFRWASNLEAVTGAEPARFVSYYKSTSAGSSVVVAAATVTR
jgi:hypothetical protein